MPRARVRDIKMAYGDRGQGGPPVVLLHGFPLDRRMWAAQVRGLAREFRVITPDLRGHGQSGAAPGPYTMELLADDVRGLLDHLGLQRVVLGGFSMGGYVAFAFYRMYPERVQALMLLDTRPQPDSADAKRGREEMAQLAEREGAAPIADRLAPRLLAAATVSGRPSVVAQVRRMILECSAPAIAGDLRGLALRRDSTDLLRGIRVPTLVVVGDQDAITPPADSEMMASTVRRAALVTVPGAGHLSNLENPRVFTGALRGFLRAVRDGRLPRRRRGR